MSSLSDDCSVKICKIIVLFSGTFRQIYKVTDEALTAKTRYDPFSVVLVLSLFLKESVLTSIITICGPSPL